MSEPTASEQRKRLINIGEIVAVCGLVISGLALWNSWKGDEPKTEQTQKEAEAIPLALRGTVKDGGKAISLAPAENAHALESLTITAAAPASGSASFGSDPIISASLLETWLPKDAVNEGVGTMTLTIDSRYIERGEPRASKTRYRVTYGWTDGGLLSGKSLRITALTHG